MRLTPKIWPKPILALIIASLSYLALPYLIFFIGWLWWPWAVTYSILLLVAIGYAGLDYLNQIRTHELATTASQLTLRYVLALSMICLILIAISGIGGYGYQDKDWEKHNFILKDLTTNEWPVHYSYYGKSVSLVYYIAYYLPAALLGKAGGWSMANNTLALWSLAGLILAVSWFVKLVNRSFLSVVVFFIIFSGLDVIGSLLRHYPIAQIWPPLGVPGDWGILGQLDAWASQWQYSSNMTLLFYAPNQAFAGWITSGLILYTILYTSSKKNLIFLWALTVLWSPFVTVGLAPYLLGDFLFERSTLSARLKKYVSISNFSGVLILMLIGFFYATKLTDIIPLLDGEIHHDFILNKIEGLSAQFIWSAWLILFCFLEFGALVLLIYGSALHESAKTRWLFKVTIILLSVLPFYLFGENNDLSMRASIPALFFLAIIAGRSIYQSNKNNMKRLLWTVLIVIAALNPLNDIARHLVKIYQRGQVHGFRFKSHYDLVTRYAVEFNLARQYISNSDTAFFQLFAKEAPQNSYPAARQPNGSRNDDHYLLFDDKIILDYHLDKQAANPGDTLNLRLKWRVIKSIDTNYSLAVRLIGPLETMLWEEQSWPLGLPTSEWGPSRDFWYDERTPVIPSDTPPGIYRLEIYFADSTTWDKLFAHALPSGNALGSIVPLTYVVVGNPAVTPRYLLSEPVSFDNQIALLGSDMPLESQAAVGETVSVRLIWKALDNPDSDYTGFVHLLDQQGQLVSQQDHPPTNGLLPTNLWQPGLMVPDIYDIKIPDELAPGTYSIVVGLYDLESGERLFAIQDDARLIGDVLKISDLIVVTSN